MVQRTIHRRTTSANALDEILDWLSQQSTAHDHHLRANLTGKFALSQRMTKQDFESSKSAQLGTNAKAQ